MGNNLMIKLEAMIEEERQSLTKMKGELRKSAERKLYMRKKGSRIYYYELRDGKQYGLNKSMDRVYDIARREYIKAIVERKERDIDILEKIILKMRDSSVASWAGVRLPDMKRICYSKDDYRWMTEAYRTNDFKPEAKRHVSGLGNKFRSKSEREIAERLEKFNIPYRYEAPITIDGRTYYPDFLIKKADGTFVIWEHFGLMDFSDYRSKAYNKINCYGKVGFVQHTNLICTFEEDVENLKKIDEIIIRFIL